VRAQIASVLANGATGEFLYNLVSDQPQMLGRTGWYAPDAQDVWAALSATHALEDQFIPVMFSSASVASGMQRAIEWRSWTLGSHVAVWIVNPTHVDGSIDLSSVVSATFTMRDYTSCAPIDGTVIAVPGYDVRVVELQTQ
jgi:hypothetical protein